jgi:four helix bundle protein
VWNSHIPGEEGLGNYQIIRLSDYQIIMAAVQRFEDLAVWKEARKLVREVYATARSGAFVKDFGLRDQICRAAVSVMSNIAEGFERGGNKEFCHFLYLAKGSAGEVRSQRYVALDLGYLQPKTFDELTSLAGGVSRELSGFIKYLNKAQMSSERGKSQNAQLGI